MSTTSTRCQDERSKDGREEGRHAQAEDSLRLEALCDSPPALHGDDLVLAGLRRPGPQDAHPDLWPLQLAHRRGDGARQHLRPDSSPVVWHPLRPLPVSPGEKNPLHPGRLCRGGRLGTAHCRGEQPWRPVFAHRDDPGDPGCHLLVPHRVLLNEPESVAKMHEESLAMGIKEDAIDADDDAVQGKERVTDPELVRSIALLLGAVFFYYMSYNAMTTNISRYASDFFSMLGGSYAIINIVTIAGGLLSYVPIANLSLKVGRKRVVLVAGLVMTVCPAIMWLFPSFTPLYYVLFLLMGASLGTIDLCVYPMILEGCSSRSVGRYSGYSYTVSMAAQVVTPILSGLVMDVAESQLFLYITVMGAAMCVFIALAKHGDSILADEILRREASSAE